MTFKEAIQSGLKIRSVLWSEERYLDSRIFDEIICEEAVRILTKNTESLSWKEILSEWEYY